MDFDLMVRARILRIRQKDSEKIKSLINSSENNVKSVRKIQLNEENATIIFREIYESVRQLGDVSWWLKGYEPLNHEISLDGLKKIDIKEKRGFNFLSRFKKIRHDANYKRFQVSVSQEEEIIDFWNKCCKEIIKIIRTKLND